MANPPLRDDVVMYLSAQEAFAALLKEHVGPRLRQLGLKGSGGRYRLDVPGMWAQVGFQKSRSSDADTVPTPTADYGDGWTQRIGPLLPTGQDVWWTVSRDDDVAVIAAPVIEALVGWGMPALRREAARRAAE